MQYVVVFGAPFEAQTFYGPFESFEDASDYADNVNEYSWIMSLHNPENNGEMNK